LAPRGLALSGRWSVAMTILPTRGACERGAKRHAQSHSDGDILQGHSHGHANRHADGDACTRCEWLFHNTTIAKYEPCRGRVVAMLPAESIGYSSDCDGQAQNLDRHPARSC